MPIPPKPHIFLFPPKLHIAKATALKRKRNENKDEIKVLQEGIEISEKSLVK